MGRKKDNIRLLIPLLSDKGKDSLVSLHFGHAPFFGIYDFGLKELKIAANDLEHNRADISPVSQIIERFDPTAVFAKDMGKRAISLFSEKGISLKTGACETAGQVINDYNGLSELSSSCGH